MFCRRLLLPSSGQVRIVRVKTTLKMQAAEFSKQGSLHAILHGTFTQKAELSVVPFISRT
jgi:hypothetical protein